MSAEARVEVFEFAHPIEERDWQNQAALADYWAAEQCAQRKLVDPVVVSFKLQSATVSADVSGPGTSLIVCVRARPCA